YIGSHTARQLGEAGERVVVLDNLIKGFRQAVVSGELVVGDVGDYPLVSRILADHQVDTVMHFAAHISVAESMANPLKYYGNNTCGTRALLQACAENNVKNFVFSSSAAVYGVPEGGYADETSPTQPINAYGTSKLMSEWMLRDVAAVNPMRYVALRYFNVAGSHPGLVIGHSTVGSHLLTKVACEAMVGKRPHVSVFGSDYPTPDGTGVRDYLHIEDLAAAHLNALDYLRSGGKSTILNVGYGHGYSVREVLRMLEQVAGKPLNIREESRRAGDPAYLVARADRVRSELGWQPRYDDLTAIVSSSLAWERKLLQDPWTN
ncbi:MAG TPA: UDP-glucose 4-epimerase GalE, partial [Steroidobacteraceae bacterium]|nr:UDP-glucose 4-epimerase GalE [Steroidobacteraceae bacterium]